MPELPEVRVVVHYLNNSILNKEISDVKVFYKPLLVETSVEEIKEKLVSQKITSVEPYGKYIIFHLEKNDLISHLRMEGKWIYEEMSVFTYGKTLVEFQIGFKDESKVLRYYDSRRFGTLQLVKKDEWKEVKGIKKLGYEPFDPCLTAEYLLSKFQKTSQPIKTLLLDQTIILGLGNIYANEVLFQAKINPYQPGKALSLNDCQKIIDASISILNDSIKNGGTTIHSFASGDNISGNYQKFLLVHGRADEKCKNCGNLIEKVEIGGRGTYFCPNCQKLK